MEAVTTMLSNAVTVFGSCWDAMTSNVPIAILVGLSLLNSLVTSASASAAFCVTSFI